MKKTIQQGVRLVQQMHPYPFWVLLLFLYGAILSFLVCGLVTWFPEVLAHPHQADIVAQQWFSVGNALVGVGGVAAPVMDLILKKDVQ